MKNRVLANLMLIGIIGVLFANWFLLWGAEDIFVTSMVTLGVPTILSVVILNLWLRSSNNDSASWLVHVRNSLLIYVMCFWLIWAVSLITPLGSYLNELDDEFYFWQKEMRYEAVIEEAKLKDEKKWNEMISSKPSTVEWNIGWNENMSAFEMSGEQPWMCLQSQKVEIQEIKLTNTTTTPVVVKTINLAWTGEEYVAGEISADKYVGSPYNRGEWVFMDKAEFDQLGDITNCWPNTYIISVWVNDSNCFVHENDSANVRLTKELNLILEPNASINIKMEGTTTFYAVDDSIRPLNRKVQFVIEQA